MFFLMMEPFVSFVFGDAKILESDITLNKKPYLRRSKAMEVTHQQSRKFEECCDFVDFKFM